MMKEHFEGTGWEFLDSARYYMNSIDFEAIFFLILWFKLQKESKNIDLISHPYKTKYKFSYDCYGKRIVDLEMIWDSYISSENSIKELDNLFESTNRIDNRTSYNFIQYKQQYPKIPLRKIVDLESSSALVIAKNIELSKNKFHYINWDKKYLSSPYLYQDNESVARTLMRTVDVGWISLLMRDKELTENIKSLYTEIYKNKREYSKEKIISNRFVQCFFNYQQTRTFVNWANKVRLSSKNSFVNELKAYLKLYASMKSSIRKWNSLKYSLIQSVISDEAKEHLYSYFINNVDMVSIDLKEMKEEFDKRYLQRVEEFNSWLKKWEISRFLGWLWFWLIYFKGKEESDLDVENWKIAKNASKNKNIDKETITNLLFIDSQRLSNWMGRNLFIVPNKKISSWFVSPFTFNRLGRI